MNIITILSVSGISLSIVALATGVDEGEVQRTDLSDSGNMQLVKPAQKQANSKTVYHPTEEYITRHKLQTADIDPRF